MHLLASTSASIDDLVEAVDLRQSPGDIVILSFADSDLSGLAAAWAAQRDVLPTVRLANLRDLRHPLSVDVWLDTVGRHAKVVVVRLLGGLDWWRYGVERLSSLARASSIALAVLPGEDRDDPRLAEASTLPTHELNTLLRFFREGGGENLGALLLRLARHSGVCLEAPEPRPVPRTAGYIPGEGAVDLDRLVSFCQRGRPCVPIIFYRAMLLAADTAPIDALCRALAERGLEPAPLVVSSLKDRAAAEFVRAALTRLKPAVIVTATAFAATTGAGEPTSRCTSCCPNSTGACCKAWSLSKGHCRHRTTFASAHSAVCRRQTGSRSWPIASRRWSSFGPHCAPSGAWRCCCPTTQARWAGPGMPSASMFRRALSGCCRIWSRPTITLPARRKLRAHCSTLWPNLRTMQPFRSIAIATSSRPFPLKRSRACRRHGAPPATTATCVMAHFVFARAPSGTSSSHSLQTEDARPIVEPTITTRLCRRATRCSRSAFGFGMLRRSTPSSTWARTALSNGSLARPSR